MYAEVILIRPAGSPQHAKDDDSLSRNLTVTFLRNRSITNMKTMLGISKTIAVAEANCMLNPLAE